MSAPATRVFIILVRGDTREYVRDRHSEDITLKGMESSCEGDTSDRIFGRGSETYAGVKRKRASEPPQLIHRHLKFQACLISLHSVGNRHFSQGKETQGNGRCSMVKGWIWCKKWGSNLKREQKPDGGHSEGDLIGNGHCW